MKKFKKIKCLEKLPIVMEILQKIDSLIADEKCGISEIAKLIEKDPALTTKLLKLANSPFYGFPQRITSVKTALNFLGVNIVKMLLIINNFLEISSQEYFLLWEHCVSVGLVCKILSKKLGFEDWDTFYTLGLIHDIGLVIEKLNFPKEFKEIVEKIKQGKSLIEAENEILKFNHCELGAYLMGNWNFPPKIVETVLAHHEINKARKFIRESALLYLGDLLVWARGLGDSILFKKLEINPSLFQILALDSEKIKELFVEIDYTISEIKTLLSLVFS